MCSTETLLRDYLLRTVGLQEDAWTIRSSTYGGRGVFATRDLRPGDLIFHDKPVVWGPRARPTEPMCASCHRHGRVSRCPAGCYLPICSPECSSSPLHVRECQLVRTTMDLPQGSWRLDLVGAVAPLRCLFLAPEDREVVRCLQGNQGKIHGFEVDLLKKNMKENLGEEDERWMRLCCLAMDTNAFEFLRVLDDGATTSLRGLYPLAAIMNHECSPNTFHHYDSEGVMRVCAARPITAGEEITTSYSSLMWSTTYRRINLARTKHFWCRCSRCRDPTEFGSMLSCLPCTDTTCKGLLLPAHPLKPDSPWFCGSCPVEVAPKQAAKLLMSQGSTLQTVAEAEPSAMAHFLVHLTVPEQSQMVTQIKTNLIWQLGHHKGFLWSDLSEEMLTLKERCCRDILQLSDILRLGFCRMKGLILLELHAALCEQFRRNKSTGITRQGLEEEIHSTLSKARVILEDDAAAKQDLDIRTTDQLQLLQL